MNRVEAVRKAVMKCLGGADNVEALKAMEHLGSAGILSSLLARKRALDVEICQCAGLLHDLWLYRHIPNVDAAMHRRHGEYGADEARGILQGLRMFSAAEIDLICRMIARHNDKDVVDGAYDELLKDADALAHCLRGLDYDKAYRYHGRDARLMAELGIEGYSQ